MICETAVLFTGAQERSIAQLGTEAQNSAVLDSACSSTVCGKAWFDAYLDSLSPENHQKVIKMEGEKVFRFGGGEKLKSIGLYIIPVELAGKKLSLKTDVVDSEIPLLMSKASMKKARITINTDNDTAESLAFKVHFVWTLLHSMQARSVQQIRSLTGFEIYPQHDIPLKNMSPNATQRSRPTTKERQDSSNTNYEWKHVMITERVQNGTEQMNGMYRVTDQVTRREFSLDLNSLLPGTRLIRM